MNTENIIFEITAASTSRSQKGDVSKYLLEQGFFDDPEMAKSIRNRDPQWSGGNPVAIEKEFEEQNPN